MVDDWIRLYQVEGVGAYLPRTENRRYDPVLKEAAVKDYLSGKGSIRTICRKYKIRDTKQLRAWIIGGIKRLPATQTGSPEARKFLFHCPLDGEQFNPFAGNNCAEILDLKFLTVPFGKM